jgi:hypothetical protein
MDIMDKFTVRLNDVIASEVNNTISKDCLESVKSAISSELGGSYTDLTLRITFNVFIVDHDGFGCGKARATTTIEDRLSPPKVVAVNRRNNLQAILRSHITSLFSDGRFNEIRLSISRIVKRYLCADLLQEEVSEISSLFDDLFLSMLIEFNIVKDGIIVADQIVVNYSKVQSVKIKVEKRNPYMEDLDVVKRVA